MRGRQKIFCKIDLLGLMSTCKNPSISSISGGGGGGGNIGGGWRCKGGGGKLLGCKAHKTLCHTQSSSDINKGFTYSNPSNSDWSIFSITFLEEEKLHKI